MSARRGRGQERKGAVALEEGGRRGTGASIGATDDGVGGFLSLHHNRGAKQNLLFHIKHANILDKIKFQLESKQSALRTIEFGCLPAP